MHGVLKDCLTAIHNLSLDIYLLMASSLKDIQHIRTSEDQRFQNMLSNKLLQISTMIEANNYRSDSEKVVCLPDKEEKEGKEVSSAREIAKELNIRVSRVTARILNLWKRIVYPQKEAGVICSCFLLLYCEVDPTVGISPLLKIRFDKAVNTMKNYSANPGYVVTVLRKTQEFIDKEMISVDTIRRVHELLGRITAENVKNIDKTLTGFIIYEMAVYAARYYEAVARERYQIEIFAPEACEKSVKESRLSEKNVGISQSDNFGIVLSGEKKQSKSISESSDKKTKTAQKPSMRISISPSKSSLLKTITVSGIQNNLDLSKFSPKNAFLSPRKSVDACKISTSRSPTPRNVNISPKKKIMSKSPSLRHSGTKNISLGRSPTKATKAVSSETKQRSTVKSLDLNLISAKKLLLSTQKMPSATSRTPPRKNESVDSSFQPKSMDHRDVLEEMQYQQFIEEKFRHFLVEKLNISFDDGDPGESRNKHEDKAMKSRETWMREFENKVGIIRYNAIKKLGDEKRFTAELIRAQRQLQIIEKLK